MIKDARKRKAPAKVCMIRKKSKSGVSMAQPQDGTNVLLENLESLKWRQRQHPANQRQIDPILADCHRVRNRFTLIS